MEITPFHHKGLSVDPNASHASTSEFNRIRPHKLLLNNISSAGSFPGHDYFRIGSDIFRLGHDLHALPPRKLRKLLTTFSDGVHVFSCVEKVNIPICADLDWPANGFDHVHPKKRPWHLCRLSYGGDEPADTKTGFYRGRNFSQMLGTTDVLHNGGNFCVHVWGSGGSSNGGGYGEGGGGHGNDSGGSQQPDFDGGQLPLSMNWHASAEEHEDTARAGTAKTDHTPENVSSDENVIMSKNDMDVFEDSWSENVSKEACSMHDTPHHVLYRILEDLDRVLSQLLPDFKRLTHHSESNQNLMWYNNVHQTVGSDTAHIRDLPGDLQDIDLALADDSFVADIKGNSNNLLEKLRGLTLGLVDRPTPRTQTVSPTQVQTCNSNEAAGLNGVDAMVFTKNFTKKLTPKEDDQTGPALKVEEQSLVGGQLQGVVDWLDRLAYNVSLKYRGHPETIGNEVEDQKLRTLVSEAVTTALKELSDADGAPAPAKQADAETLRRLQREVFSELLKLREKLDQVASARHSDNAKHLPGAGKTNLQGEVKVGMAFVMLEDSSSRHSRGSLEQAGMQTGVDVKLTFETPFREKDVLITECIAGQGSSVGEGRALGGPMSLGKVQYLAHINDGVSISFVPMGARGIDVTDIVNPMQDQGLTSFSSRGPALFDHCKGSAIGATWSGSSFALSAAHYLSGWGNQTFSLGTDARELGPLCLSTLGQLLLQPTECLIFSLSGLNRFWPSPPLPSSMGLHWSEMGPLIIPKIHSLQTSRSTMSSEDSFLSHCNSMSSHWGMPESEYHLGAPESKGTSQLSMAVATEMELSENLSLGAWAQVDDVLQELDKGNFQWALNLAKTSKNGVDWGASIGGSRPDFWSISTCEQEMYPGFVGGVEDSYGPQLHVEAFVRLSCGKGFTLQPGLLYLLNKHSRTPAFIVRSSWLF